ncbi:uncharacterized protein LAESUDRAFT_670416 [Laetiporus sulphureus 93-53]|uniref:T6SS Phospholipase effector Tle1-like catalytic domain-containing protein n=1 Tax=Laetiporus sulphureus 93-53 TaxID=1314785 RepID=A0A165HS62_9APHY|nr:uncharacterized protein LAESUDRAFT_670416 [Laetiporus sulphureus 93-53]KZT12113.1 hypothetical protein LAESUDRAFT_670416 [Laetiporus sulphureus 93-53]
MPAQTFSICDDSPKKPRTLVLCFDGTADHFDGKNTNVVKLYALLKKEDNEQLCYYQPGIGTYLNPGVVSPLFQWGAKVLDQAVAWYLEAHVRGGYRFLMQNYQPGDKICLFGFSRGAYTARALAGMLHKIGLLPTGNAEQIPFACKLYKQTGPANARLAAGFKRTFCRTVQIEFVGVWDTVASVGTLFSRTLPFIANNTTIKTFRHALALDEHRAKFRPNLYHHPTPPAQANDKTARQQNVASPPPADRTPRKDSSQRFSRGILRQALRKRSMNQGSSGEGWATLPTANADLGWSQESEKAEEIVNGTDVLEVWFAGCHCDIGGSAVGDDEKLALSDITLRWMVRQIVASQCGIVFDQAELLRANIPDSIFGFPVTPPLEEKRLRDDPSSSTEGSGEQIPVERPAVLDKMNAVQPMHDQLKQIPVWWLLEVTPTSYNWQEPNGRWHTGWSVHLGKGRHLPPNPYYHITVKERMQDKALRYRPRAILQHGSEIKYVD